MTDDTRANSETFQEIEQDERDFLSAWGDTPTQTDMDVRLDWLMERIAKRTAQIERNNQIAEARRLHIEDWRRSENDKLERAVSWFSFQVRQLLPMSADDFEATYGKRSRALPFGVVGYKKQPDHIEVFDDAKALAWAKAHGLETTVKESVSKTALKAALVPGVEPEGFEVIKGLDEFYCKPTKEVK